jgi:hypothetical protein
MKTLFTLLLMLTTFMVSAQSRTINLDSIKKAPKTEVELSKNAIRTTSIATYGAVNYPIYQTQNGKFFIIVKSKSNGNLYRKYFKWETLAK